MVGRSSGDSSRQRMPSSMAAAKEIALAGPMPEFTAKYPLISIEDGLAEDDWDGWRELTVVVGEEFLTHLYDRLATGTVAEDYGQQFGLAERTDTVTHGFLTGPVVLLEVGNTQV